jgi:soluble lytic murein transglycosylase-like protein
VSSLLSPKAEAAFKALIACTRSRFSAAFSGAVGAGAATGAANPFTPVISMTTSFSGSRLEQPAPSLDSSEQASEFVTFLSKVSWSRVDFHLEMGTPGIFWLLVILLATPLVNSHAQTASANLDVMEGVARKQREATAAAMQPSLDKQRAAIAAGFAAAEAKGAAGKFFFALPPLAASNPLTPSFPLTSTESAQPDCPPTPEAEIAPVLLQAAQREGLEMRLLTAVIQQESAFRPCAVSAKGAQGLMQLMPATSEQFGVKDPFNIKQNVDAGAKYLKELLTRYNGDLRSALGAYNAGPSTVDSAGGVPEIAETTAYVNEILKSLKAEPAVPQLAKPE